MYIHFQLRKRLFNKIALSLKSYLKNNCIPDQVAFIHISHHLYDDNGLQKGLSIVRPLVGLFLKDTPIGCPHQEN